MCTGAYVAVSHGDHMTTLHIDHIELQALGGYVCVALETGSVSTWGG